MRMIFRPLTFLCLFACLLAAGCGSALNSQQEVSLGEQAAPKFVAEGGGQIPDPQIQAYVKGIGQKLLSQLTEQERRGMPFEFFALDTDLVNAFALPGGKVFVTRGLLARLENEAQLAGVMGHEIGHVVRQHIGKQMRQQQGVQVLAGVAGAVSDNDWISTLGAAGGKLYILKFGRTQELEADQEGLEFMYRAGYPPMQMKRVMKILQSVGAGKGVEMLQTHPHPEARIDQINALVPSRYAKTVHNPAYVENPQPYQSNVLSRLAKLPPPKNTAP